MSQNWQKFKAESLQSRFHITNPQVQPAFETSSRQAGRASRQGKESKKGKLGKQEGLRARIRARIRATRKASRKGK